uniref:Toxin candidate TRINITY_DN19491_c0_g1_i1 n=1 Tax=Ceriantheomorphe brasiliensis TaxID=1048506 RepID=A0A7G7WZ51_9CNID|nr:toxin candidate TRINITY_DN19491_c0_g1_i1 [Ceriantheomorphe brasiliensis]
MTKVLIVLLFLGFSFADKPEWVPYISPMMLGRTFDKSTNQVGVDIINLDDITNTESVNGTREFMKFKAGESDESKKKLLDVGGSLALKIKGGFIKVSGSGQYIKDEGTGEKYYELLTLVQRKTRIISLASEVTPNSQNVGSIIGKHYVSKIQYGANLIASLRFKYTTNEEKENIKAAIEGSISDTSGSESFDIQASADLTKVDEKLGKKTSLEIKYYADVQLDDVPQNIEDFKALVKRFSTLVADTEDGLGRPILAYVQPLTDIFENMPEYNPDRKTHERLPYLERELNDLITAKNRLYTVLKDKRTLTDKQEKWTAELYKTILDALIVYRQVISKLDLESGTDQFKKTNEAYLKIEDLELWADRYKYCPQKRESVKAVTANKYRQLTKQLICHMDKYKSNSIYDQQVQKILDLKTNFMGVLKDRNDFLNEVLTLSKDYTTRAKQVFQHYFMATREGPQSGLKKGGVVKFETVKLESTLKSGYDKLTGVFTAPMTGLYFLSQHVSGTNMDMDNDGQGACPITQAHTKSFFKKMKEGERYDVKSDTDRLDGQSSFMGILVDIEKSDSSKVCSKKDEFEDESEESGNRYFENPDYNNDGKESEESEETEENEERALEEENKK